MGEWLVFDGVSGLNITGNGLIEGNGKSWWDNSCKLNPKKVYTSNSCKLILLIFFEFSSAITFQCYTLQGCTKLAPTVSLWVIVESESFWNHGLIWNWWKLLIGCIFQLQALGFRSCNDVRMSRINVMRSPQTHILVLGCKNVGFSSLVIQSPGSSPNTDGIHVSDSLNVTVRSSIIGTGTPSFLELHFPSSRIHFFSFSKR